MTYLNLISAQDKQTGSQRGIVSIPSDMFPESVEQKMENFHGFDWKFSRNFKPVSMRRFRLLKSQVLLRVSLYAAHISGERAGSCVWVPLHNWKVFLCVSALIRVESRTAERALCKSACTWMRVCVCVCEAHSETLPAFLLWLRLFYAVLMVCLRLVAGVFSSWQLLALWGFWLTVMDN